MKCINFNAVFLNISFLDKIMHVSNFVAEQHSAILPDHSLFVRIKGEVIYGTLRFQVVFNKWLYIVDLKFVYIAVAFSLR